MTESDHVKDCQECEPPRLLMFSSRVELLGPFYLPALLFTFTKAMTMITFPLEVLALGFSYDTVGILSSTMGVGSVLANVPAGSFVSATSVRTGSMVGGAILAFVAVCALGAIFCPEPLLALLLLALAFGATGVADTTSVVSRVTLLSAAVKPSFRGTAAATLGGVLRVSNTLGPFVAGIVAHYVMSGAVYLLMAASGIAAIVVSFVFIPRFNTHQNADSSKEKKSHAKSSESRTDRGDKVEMTKNKPTTLSVVRNHFKVLSKTSVFCFVLLIVRRARELLLALEGRRLELSSSTIGYITALSFLTDGSMFPVAGKMLDRVGRIPTGVCSLTGLAVSIILLQGDSVAFYIVFALLGGVSNGISAGIVQVISADLAPPECRSQFIAVLRMVARCGDIAAPAIVGIVAEITSLKTSGLIIAGVGLIGAVWAFFFVADTIAKDTDPALTVALQPCNVGKPKDIGDIELTPVGGDEDAEPGVASPLSPASDSKLQL
eukprot:TRINITY_DN74409_c0_g1_i1.p1 TRINITY_DN74409_c0_g1~~TRINITY_DN74409_c0_g1_i1.p1  ORF type:complete len:534 (-),score=81.01 TRINITY_DN74409_c0_g1_i1:18-1493(-)